MNRSPTGQAQGKPKPIRLPIDPFVAMMKVADWTDRMSAEKAAKRYGVSIDYVLQRVRAVEKTAPDVLDSFKNGKLSFSKVRLLSALPFDSQLEYLPAAEKLVMSKLQKHISQKGHGRYFDDGNPIDDPDGRLFLKRLSEKLGAPLDVKSTRKGFSIEVGFTGIESMSELVLSFGSTSQTPMFDVITKSISPSNDQVGVIYIHADTQGELFSILTEVSNEPTV